MKNWLTNPRNAAWLGVLLPLPIAFVFIVAGFNIEPINGFLRFYSLATAKDETNRANPSSCCNSARAGRAYHQRRGDPAFGT